MTDTIADFFQPTIYQLNVESLVINNEPKFLADILLNVMKIFYTFLNLCLFNTIM